MILGPISYLDCVVFLLLLAPQLFLQGHFFELFNSIFFSIKFLCKPLELPFRKRLHSLTSLVNSCLVAISIFCGKIFDTEKSKISLCAASKSVSGSCCSMCSSCLCSVSSTNWPSILLEKCCSTFSKISDATTWSPKLTSVLE